MHLFGGRGILQKLEHMVAIDNRAFCSGDVFAQFERIRIGQPHQHFAVIGLEIGYKVFQATHQAFAIGGHRAF